MALLSGIRNRLAPLRHHRQVIHEGSWVLIGQAVNGLAMLVGGRIVTQFVNPETFGMFSLLFGLANLARNILCVPVLQAGQRLQGDVALIGELGWLRQTLTRMLTVLTGCLVAVLLAGGAIYSQFSGISIWVFVWLAAYLATDVPKTLEFNLLVMARRQKAATLVNGGENILRPVLIVAMVLAVGSTVTAVLLGYTAGAVLGLAASIWLVRRDGLGVSTISRETFRRLSLEVIRFGMPLVPLAVVSWISGVSDRYIIGTFLSMSDVGIYAAIYGLMSQPFMIAQGVVSRTLMSRYYKAVSEGSRAKERRVQAVWLAATCGVCGLGFIGVLLFKEWIIFALAPKYRTGVGLMPWIAAGYCLQAVAVVFSAQLYAYKRTGLVVLGESIVAAASIVLVLVMVRYWGLGGVAMACPIYFGLMVVIMASLSRWAGASPLLCKGGS